MIDQLRTKHPVRKLCDLLNVAKSGYQAWSSGKVIPPRKLEDLRLLVAIKAAHQRGRAYGPSKIQSELADQGLLAGINRIKRLRKLHGIRCIHKKKFKITTDSKHNLPIAHNLLGRQFAQTTAPNQVWVTDITYIPTDEGWLYLAACKDLHTCEIVGWAMDSRMTKTLVLDALRAAYWRKKPKPGLMHHSDRGSQYCSEAYRALQASYGMKTSMSRWKAFGTLKNESLHHYRFATREQARQVVLNTSKCSITVSGVMPKVVIESPLISLISFTPTANKLRHNSHDLPVL